MVAYILYLPVLELALQSFLGKGMLAGSHFFQCLAYLGTGFGSSHDIQPVLFGSLGVGSHDFYLVAALEYLLQLYVLAVYFGTDAFAS